MGQPPHAKKNCHPKMGRWRDLLLPSRGPPFPTFFLSLSETVGAPSLRFFARAGGDAADTICSLFRTNPVAYASVVPALAKTQERGTQYMDRANKFKGRATRPLNEAIPTKSILRRAIPEPFVASVHIIPSWTLRLTQTRCQHGLLRTLTPIQGGKSRVSHSPPQQIPQLL